MTLTKKNKLEMFTELIRWKLDHIERLDVWTEALKRVNEGKDEKTQLNNIIEMLKMKELIQFMKNQGVDISFDEEVLHESIKDTLTRRDYYKW